MNIESLLLSTLSNQDIPSSFAFAKGLNNVSHQEVIGVMNALAGDQFVSSSPMKARSYVLTTEGVIVCANGSQEAVCFAFVKAKGEAGCSREELEAGVGKDVCKVGMGNCMKQKWIKKAGDTMVATVDSVDDSTQKELKVVSDSLNPNKNLMNDDNTSCLSDKVLNVLKKRKLVKLEEISHFKITKGPQFALERKKKAADLTKEMLDSGEWKTAQFRPYNFQTVGEKVGGGYLHPLLKVRAEFRKILMEMGFNEMPTNKWVESSFWNFDALFQPQSHPARDAHDTFFIKNPELTRSVPEEYYERVKSMHEKGGNGSIGYRYDFQKGEAMKNLLRTHTTAISSQMLWKLANQQGGFKPMKYFSIDRVFRNESMDATHLCEFHQVEGVVADYNLSLGDLLGTIETFFNKVGITKLRFKPAFNPYTEPSMEIFGYHPDLKKWTEIGNSGMFRPEMLAPMGLPENVRVIAWGLSLERPTMIKYRIDNIRNLFGHKVELNRTRSAPVCRFD
ncbi:hypothetical protein ScalyP_jg1688 [Parmales sp. scaly parma]|nr:hypothetical protein ScalyP_jg1688 [Parmales sp. scaly parma]